MGLNWSKGLIAAGSGLKEYSAKLAKEEYMTAASATATNAAQMENNKFLYEDAGKQIISLNKLLSGRNEFGAALTSLGAGDKTRIENAIRGLETTRQGLYGSIAGWEPLTEEQQKKNKSEFEEALRILKEFQASGQEEKIAQDLTRPSEHPSGDPRIGPPNRDEKKAAIQRWYEENGVFDWLDGTLESMKRLYESLPSWLQKDKALAKEVADEALAYGGGFEDYGDPGDEGPMPTGMGWNDQGDPGMGSAIGEARGSWGVQPGMITQGEAVPEKEMPQYDPFTGDDDAARTSSGKWIGFDSEEGIVTHGKDFYEEITPTNLTPEQIEERAAWDAGQAEFNKYIGSPEALDSLENIGLKTTNIPQESDKIEMDKHGLANRLSALIKFAEARTHGYNSVAGSGEADPDITRMTVGEIKEKYGNKAVGIGQFQYDFISDVANRYLDIKEKELKEIVFSESFQDQLITLGLEKAGITLFLKGEISQEEFQKKLHNIWRGLGPDKESLPGDSSDEYGNKVRTGGGLIDQVLGRY
jgi:hypothetical protein